MLIMTELENYLKLVNVPLITTSGTNSFTNR